MSQETFEAKKNFVARELSRCIAASHPGVMKLEYQLHDDGDRVQDEVVIIRFDTGFTKRVNVTADSLHATVADVLSALD